VANIIKFSWK